MTKLLPSIAAMFFMLVSLSATAAPVDNQNPYLLIEVVANQTFDRFKQEQAKIAADPEYLKVIVTDELMPYVDAKYAAYKVLGKYLQQTTPEQRDAFADAFKQYLIATYAQAFTEYTNQEIAFSPAKDFSKEKIVSVDVVILAPGRPNITVAFKMRRLKNNDWKAIDMVAEGVSLLASKESEVAGIISREGIDAVITQLGTLAAKPITPKSNAKGN
ncbi:ABC transporter substrate-binding protein [Shewanella sp. SNU WT4]|uniref:MlaC/ttg2D family ABC transporter substrate-binding protein n=1 Tax=Shewanella sp. SNU WT4 TaxID=2590015 RepID=UPI001125CA0D|nr:ABC transporter substrate-binding protein [Shewanella sp. SNU WT4]QDF66009.1 ABC transporter substrate-binding protein [Shewanella sp. SNU WT4]